MEDGNVSTGKRGERIAAEYLELAGCRIIRRNYRAGPLEIDLVARDGACVVFVEVKLRRGGVFGGALEAVGRDKLRRLHGAARCFIASTPDASRASEYRFDLVALDVDPGGGGMVLRHLRGIG